MKKKNYIDPNFDKTIKDLLPFLVVDVKVDGEIIEFTDEDDIDLIKMNISNNSKNNLIKYKRDKK
ncbi:MAG: hypothetical protein MR296_00635 [Tenericutes bacterium]|nr:hypothetical protein [Mycoplasmatota bacterium]